MTTKAKGGADDTKKLRKQLKKAETRVAKATKKRDEAQARLDAVSVIAADLANRLASAEAAAATAPARPARKKRTSTRTSRRASTGGASSTKKATRTKAAASGRGGASRSR